MRKSCWARSFGMKRRMRLNGLILVALLAVLFVCQTSMADLSDLRLEIGCWYADDGGTYEIAEAIVDTDFDPPAIASLWVGNTDVLTEVHLLPGTTFTNFVYVWPNGVLYVHEGVEDPDGMIQDWCGGVVIYDYVPEPVTVPEIDVDVEELSYDYGDVDINGAPVTFVIPIYNLGDGNLTVSSVTIAGSGDFAITDIPAGDIVIAPSETIGVDIEITYTPSAEGLVDAVVTIVSNDEDESVIEVALTGCGIVVVSPEQQQIRDILDFYDVSVADITIIGYGPGKSAPKRLKALRNMIKAAGDLINLGEYELAAKQLRSVAKKTDGEKRPPDFVVGYSVDALNAMVDDLIADLTL